MDYAGVNVGIRRLNGLQGAYIVELRSGELVVSGPVTLNWDEIRDRVKHLGEVRISPVVSSAREITPARRSDFRDRLKSLGLMVYDLLFQGEMRREFLNLLASPRSLHRETRCTIVLLNAVSECKAREGDSDRNAAFIFSLSPQTPLESTPALAL